MPYSEKQIAEWADPTAADLADPLFEAIWQATKSWDVNVPKHYVGYCGMNGSHVMWILNALRPLIAAVRKETMEECEKDAQDAKRYRWLVDQAGYYQDGSQTVVELVQDDATRTCFIKVGSKYYGQDNHSFSGVIDAAIRNLQEREEGKT